MPVPWTDIGFLFAATNDTSGPGSVQLWRIALFPVAKADSKPLSKITRSFVMGPEGGRTVIVLQELETCAGRLFWGAVGLVGED